MVEKGWGLRDHETLELGVSHKWYMMNWADRFNDICRLRVMDIHWSYQNLLFWACIVWHRLSVNQIVRCFKLKKLKNYMRYQVDFLLPLKLQKISYYFGLCWKILLANQFEGFFTFDMFDLLILIPVAHCYIVLVFLSVVWNAGSTLFSEFLLLFILIVVSFVVNWSYFGMSKDSYNQKRFFCSNLR